MKKSFLTPMLTWFACVFLTNFSFSQIANTPVNGESQSEKITGLEEANEKHFVEVSKMYVPAKVMRSFMELFKDAPETKWYTLDNKYLALFIKNGHQTRALFGKNGYVFYTIRYGAEKDLPANVRKLIKSHYVDYVIGCVRDVYSLSQKVWIVNLQLDDNLTVVRVTADGALDVLYDNKEMPGF